MKLFFFILIAILSNPIFASKSSVNFVLKINNDVEISFKEKDGKILYKKNAKTSSFNVDACSKRRVEHFARRIDRLFKKSISLPQAKDLIIVEWNNKKKSIPSQANNARIFNNIKLEMQVLKSQIEMPCKKGTKT